jgi:hypothetical protein
MDGHFQKVCGIRHECLRHIGQRRIPVRLVRAR